MKGSFHSSWAHGFVRAAVATPFVRVADPVYNAERTLELSREASEAGAGVVVFPELGLSAYSDEDLFHQDALLDATREALRSVVEASASLVPVLLVGAPLRFDGRLFNCAVAVHGGRILGVAPKSYLPNYREFYEKRQFTSGRLAVSRNVRLLGQDVPFGADLLFEATTVDDFVLHVEVCEDLWAPIPVSTYGALAGATVLANLSASNITVGKADYRRLLCRSQSGRSIAAYLYSASGFGESTTDLAWDGHGMIWENARLLAESERFSEREGLLVADVDLESLVQDRMRHTTFNDALAEHGPRVRAMRRVPFELEVPDDDAPLRRTVERFPYVPSDPRRRDERCEEVYDIQVHGLAKRLRATGIERVVIGVSGGLDSTQALLVAVRAMDELELPRTNVLGYSLPGFGTTERTRENARALMEALGVTAAEIDIRPAAEQTLEDLDHPWSRGEKVHDVTFENVQAGQRTSHLFRLANQHDALVVGTSDLSELALGWTTYGVGDQMSHYAVNASVPKTLIQHLVHWIIDTGRFDGATRDVLVRVLATEISPELVPAEREAVAGEEGEAVQSTEAVVGPYALQDFHLYYVSRYGFRPSKVAFLCHHAWSDAERGDWPGFVPEDERRAYGLAEIKKWLRVFLERFVETAQFKRSALPNGPKVGSGGSLSPRGDWRAPSDAEARAWLDELEENVPEE